MTEIIDWLSQEDEPERKEVAIGDDTMTMWFRRISAGERELLLSDMKINSSRVSSGFVDIDLGKNERQKQLLVMFSTCTEDGQRIFKNVKSVKSIPDYKFAILVDHATQANEVPGEDLGKD
jgi:hypothetical protein